jgi:hypothetical protein
VESRVNQGAIRATVQPPARNPYHRILLNLRHPRRVPMKRAVVNGKEHSDCDFENGVVRLAPGASTYTVEVRY